MSRINVAFDMDGVIIDLKAVFERFIREDFGAEILPYNSWEVQTEPKLTGGQIWACIEKAYDQVAEIPVYPGIRHLFCELHRRTGLPVKVVTARPVRAAQATYDTMEKVSAGLFPYELAIVQGSARKLPYLNGLQYFVEDRFRTAKQLAAVGKTVYLLDRPYNRKDQPDPPGVHRIQDVRELIALVPQFIETVN